MVNGQSRISFIIGLFLLVSLTACASPLASTRGAVTSSILSDTHIGPVPLNQEVIITSRHQAPSGITRVDFFVNGTLEDTQIPPFPQVDFITENRWTPRAEGTYTIKIVAHSKDGGQAEIVQTIEAKANIIPVATIIRATETRPVPTRPPGGTALACLNEALLVSEAIIPAQVDPGAVFNKTWKIRNIGTCPWVAGYYFDLVSGETLGGSRVNLDNLAPVEPQAEIDITIPMVAPTTGGSHGGDWRLFDAAGNPFGPTFTVRINIAPGCENVRIEQFEAVPANIVAGQNSTLFYNVTGASSIRLEPGPQLTPPSGSILVSPSATTTYRLIAQEGDCVLTQDLTVTVVQATITPPSTGTPPVGGIPAAPTDLRATGSDVNQVALAWTDNSNNETSFRLFSIQGGVQVPQQEFPANSSTGNVANLNCATTYSFVLFAVNANGSSAPSNTIAVQTQPCP
jgi:hypothetical protein